jgi:mannose-6-phosphate isomerase-like protein (cupin superfamily)
MNVVSKYKPLNHYFWGKEQSQGWVFVDEKSLSVKLERMAGHSSESSHVHQYAQQFFFILKGQAVFEIENDRYQVLASEGIQVPAGKKHRILNESDQELEFLLSSGPTTTGDRTERP